LCYQNWKTSTIYIGEEKFYPARKYYATRQRKWFNDLDAKSKTGDLRKEDYPPAEQRRAWMAVKDTLIRRYSMVDYSTSAPNKSNKPL
ncbi:unnamed protein product, partial [Didymodactylos carnosus]